MYSQSDTDDEDLPVPKHIFMSDRTVHNLHSLGWYETEGPIDANDSRVLQINDTVFRMDDMMNHSDMQYEAFLLEVERANDEFFKNKNRQRSNNTYRLPASSKSASHHSSYFLSGHSLGMSAAAANMEFESYENGDYDVDNIDDLNQMDYHLGDEKADEDEHLEKDCDGDEESVEDDDEVDVEENDANDELPIVTVQKVSAGYIINSNVYLTLPQWHTLLTDADINQTYCVLCDEYIDLSTDSVHIEDSEHLNSLKLFKPLKRFELSITRLIRTKYHCGVCNVLFDDQEDNNHVDSKQHGDNMLFAINKASDLVYDYNLDKSRDDTSAPSGDTLNKRCKDYMTYPVNTPSNGMSYSACFTKPHSNGAQYDDTTDQDLYEETYDQMSDTQTPGVSYAAMAKKIKMDELPDLLKIDLGDKLVTVKFDSWHMIISTGLNRLYCMACRAHEQKRTKADHCRSSSHLERLMKCTVVQVYGTHLIRMVDDKLYHCGHCNNLQPINLMEEHVEQYHPRSSRLPAPTKSHETHPTSSIQAENQLPGSSHVMNHGNDQLGGSSQAWHNQAHPLLGLSLTKNHDNYQPVSSSPTKNQGNNQLPGTIQAKSQGSNQLVSSPARTPNPQLASPNPANNNGINSSASHNHQISGAIQTRNLENHLQTNSNRAQNKENQQSDNHKRDSPITEAMKETTNLQRLKSSGLSKTTESINNPAHIDLPSSPHKSSQNNLAVTQNTERRVSSPTNPIEYFQSIWAERSPAKASPKIKETSNAQISTETATSSDAQISKDNSKKPEISSSSVETKASTPPPLQSQQPPAKTIPVINFQPDYIKTIHQFGYKLSVHILSLNAIIKMQFFYRCVFCDVDVEESFLLEHMLDYRHVALIPTAPYLPEFSLHLIRRIRLFAHCAICNLVLPNDHMMVLAHNGSPTHAELLKRAIGFTAPSVANPALPGYPNIQPGTQSRTVAPSIPLPPLIPLPPGHRVPNSLPPLNTSFAGVVPPAASPKADATETKIENNGKHTARMNNETDGKQNKKIKTAPVEELLVDYSEECYLVKQRKQLMKVQRDALNTIVFCGDGTLYCFVCETNIGTGDSMEHIGDKGHRKSLTECKMLSNYGNGLLRQLDNMFHCATCNVVVQKKFLQRHLDWYKHLKNIEESFCNSGNDKLDENQLEIPKINVLTQKERLNVKDKGKFVIHFAFVVDRNHGRKECNDNLMQDEDGQDQILVKKMNKIVIVKDEVFKIKWHHWHGLVSYKNGYKCKICNVDFEEEDWKNHIQESKHVTNLAKPMIEELGRDLLRQLTDSKLHCLICNVELSTSDNICGHLDGKKHNKNRDLIIEESAKVNAYSDCEKDVLFL